MNVDLVIKNGTLVTSNSSISTDLAINAGKIVVLGKGDFIPNGRRTIDAEGKFVLPGLIDGHVHFRDPGLEYKEDFSTGSMAAAYGGITCAIEMPNSKPPTSNEETVLLRQSLIQKKSFIDIGLIGVLTPDNSQQIELMAKAGILGYKIYMGESVGGISTPDNGTMVDLMARAARTGLRIAFHAEDNGIIQYKIDQIKSTGRKDPLAFIESRPILAEVEAISKAGLFASYTQAKIHIYHVSSRDGAEMISNWKKKGVDITGETCPQYLFLRAEEDMPKLGSIVRVNPPIRAEGNGDFLYKSLLDGTIDLLTTDHAPHSLEEKITSDIWQAASGFIGVETSIQLMISEAIHKRGISLNHLVKICSENPARVWGLWPRKGSLSIGADADISIIDLEKEWTIDQQKLHSKNWISPWHGWKGKGQSVTTIVRGSIIIQDGQFITDHPIGEMVLPSHYSI